MINYYLLTKPGIILGNLITVTAGFLLASTVKIDLSLLLSTLIGIAFIIASACVFNNYIDRAIDQKMVRTKKRALVLGVISEEKALLFATSLGIIGGGILFFATNLLTLLVASLGFFVYVILYSLWKGHTIYGTAIGSIAGATPPVVGYCAVSNQFDMGASILFMMMILWQMPHFYAIAMLHLEDYKRANIPLLPILKGSLRTKIHSILYIAAFIIVASLLTFFDYTGALYLAVALGLGFLWLYTAIKGIKSSNDQLWGKQMFRLSLLMINGLCFMILFDRFYLLT